MDTQPTFGPNDLLSYLIADIAAALSARLGQSQSERHQAATGTLLAFCPSDPVEAMLAGHCVMFHELIVENLRRSLRGEEPATRDSIVALDKAFGNNLTQLVRYRCRQAEAAPAANRRTETDIADRVRRHESHTGSQHHPVSDIMAAAAPQAPSPGAPAASLDAKPAVGTSGPAHSAPGPADGHPTEAGTPTAQMPCLNRQARRANERQARKHIAPAPARCSPAAINQTHNGPAATISATAAD